MMRWLALVVLVGCYRSAPPAPPIPVVAPAAAAEPDADPDPDQACKRYNTLFSRLDECPQLPQEDRQRLVQIDTDMQAAESESGMDGSSPYDSERGCEQGNAVLMQVAASICGWTDPP